jgi:CopG antitoxin of type II toxin-antitoxin system
MSNKSFEAAFDDGESIIDRLDLATARRVKPVAQRVNVDFPPQMLAQIDRQAQRRGVTRQALIKMWLADRLEAA